MVNDSDPSDSTEYNSHKLSQYLEEIGQLRGALEQTESQSRRQIEYLERMLEQSQQQLQQIYRSRGWRIWMGITLPLRILRIIRPDFKRLLTTPWLIPSTISQARQFLRDEDRDALERLEKRSLKDASNPHDAEYQAWINNFELANEPQTVGVEASANTISQAVKIALVMVLKGQGLDDLKISLDSLFEQKHPLWELWLIGSAAMVEAAKQVLPESDKRIRFSVSSTDDIDQEIDNIIHDTNSDLIGQLQPGDRLAEDALYYVAVENEAHPEAVLIYSDEDKMDGQGYRYNHYFKPDYNPDLILSQDYISRLGLFRRSKALQLGGVSSGYGDAVFYELMLRICRSSDNAEIRHIERVLYHIGEDGVCGFMASVDQRISAVQSLLADGEVQAEVSKSPLIEGGVRVRYLMPDSLPLVSIIIPTRNGLHLLKQCIESIQQKTDYKNYEILIVDNHSDEPEMLAYLEKLNDQAAIRVLPYPGIFNFSAINNFAVKQAKGELLAFLNNDIEVISNSWLDEMASHALREQTGAVGARLWYPDDRLQHAGVIVGIRGLAGHAMKFLPMGLAGYQGRALQVQNYTALTAACLVVRKEVFSAVGGFDEVNLAVAFNDVDFCLRLVEAGYSNVWTPFAELYHHESATRGAEDTQEKQLRFQGEVHYMLKRWERYLEHDPAYNRNLTRVTEGFELSW
ncbi:MAG: glycosyltransferase family 2 protein [Candidatus Thiodiazotropha sp.]